MLGGSRPPTSCNTWFPAITRLQEQLLPTLWCAKDSDDINSSIVREEVADQVFDKFWKDMKEKYGSQGAIASEACKKNAPFSPPLRVSDIFAM